MGQLRERRFTIPKCDNCGHRWFPPSLLCPNRHSDKYRWEEVSGQGIVFSFVTFHRVYHPAFAEDVPYVVGIVELKEGPRLLSNIIGIPPNKVFCGMQVEIRIEEMTPDVMVPKFAPL